MHDKTTQPNPIELKEPLAAKNLPGAKKDGVDEAHKSNDLKARIAAKKQELQTALNGLKDDQQPDAAQKRDALKKKLGELDTAVRAGGDKPDALTTTKLNDWLSKN